MKSLKMFIFLLSALAVTFQAPKSSPGAEDKTQWIDVKTSKIISLENEDTTRIEIMYGKNENVAVTLIAPDGSIHIGSSETSDSALAVKNTFLISSFDMKCRVIYLTQTGRWTLSVSSQTEQDIFVLTSEVPENWNEITKERKTVPMQIILWHVNKYTKDDIPDIIKEAEGIDMQPVEVPEAETDRTTKAAAYLLIIIITSAGLWYFCRRTTKKRIEDKRIKHIKEATRLMNEAKGRENEVLEKMMFSDIEEYGYYEEKDYRNWQPPQDEEKAEDNTAAPPIAPEQKDDKNELPVKTAKTNIYF